MLEEWQEADAEQLEASDCFVCTEEIRDRLVASVPEVAAENDTTVEYEHIKIGELEFLFGYEVFLCTSREHGEALVEKLINEDRQPILLVEE